jgi:hypothetical protein
MKNYFLQVLKVFSDSLFLKSIPINQIRLCDLQVVAETALSIVTDLKAGLFALMEYAFALWGVAITNITAIVSMHFMC